MIELRTLGSLELRDASGREIRSVLAQPKRLALLAYLAVGALGGFVRRDTLLGLFWPESDDERARGAFRQAVRYLRRSLGEAVLVNRAEDELGIAAGVLRCDAAELRSALGRGDAAAALNLYRGELLPGLFVADAPEFERWLAGERAALQAEAAGAAWLLAEAAAAREDSAAARDWARRAAELAPLDEAGVRRRIALLDGAGDRAGAVRVYEEFVLRLRRELELEPAPETQTLVDAVRQRQRAGAADAGGGVGEAGGESAHDAPQPSRGGERGGKVDRAAAAAAIVPLGETQSPASAAPPTPRRTRRAAAVRLALAGSIAVLVLTGLAYLAQPRAADPPLNPRRVVVPPFENRTGDPLLDPVASMAADWIVQGLSGRGVLEVVPVTAALASAPFLVPTAGGASLDRDPRPLARETGAGTAVSGSYYRQGDSIHFQARIIDASTGRLISAVDPVAAPADAPLEGIDPLRNRVLIALAPLTDERDTHVRHARAPPSYEAYRDYVAGFEHFVRWDFAAALRFFERAAAADSAFLMPAIAAGIMHSNLGNWAVADSIVRRVERFRDESGPLEAATLDMLSGWLRGDEAAAYEAAVRQARIAPGSIGEYQVAEQARRLNRPRETIRVLTEMGAERGELRGWLTYWREMTMAHHMLGDHREELRAARRARELYPTAQRAIYQEVVALAALGRVAEVNARIEERLASTSREWPSPAALMAAAAREFRVHGQPAAAEALFERSLAWYRSQPASGPTSAGLRPSIGIVLYDAGRWEEAEAIFRSLAAAEPENLTYQGYLGVIAARRDDRPEAERISAWLGDREAVPMRGHHTLWRARIAAVLGDGQPAVELLRQAFAQGRHYDTWHHTAIDFDPIRDHPAFRELVRPKG